MTTPESQNPQPPSSLRERAEAGDPEAITMLALLAGPPLIGYSTLPLRNPVDIAAILHRKTPAPQPDFPRHSCGTGPATSTHQETRTDDRQQ